MYNLFVALLLTTAACFVITSYDSTQYLNDQTVYFQQVYFEVPFYQFLIVIAAVLFNYQELYEELNLICKTEDTAQENAMPLSPASRTNEEQFMSARHESIRSLDNASMLMSDQNLEHHGGTLFSNHNQPLLNRDRSSSVHAYGPLANRDSNIDNIDRDRHDDSVQQKLSYRFYLYMGLIITAQVLNTFFVLYHVFDSKGSETTVRYKLG